MEHGQYVSQVRKRLREMAMQEEEKDSVCLHQDLQEVSRLAKRIACWDQETNM